MREEKWKNAFESLGPSPEAQDRIWEKLAQQTGEDPAQKLSVQPRRRGRTAFRVLLLAAALAGAMGATAYAAGLFGREALEVTEPGITPQKLVIGEDQKGHFVDNPEEGAIFSITQPQEVPEDLDPAIREKVENNKAAWAEWQDWLEDHAVRLPAVFDPPEGTQRSELEENDDGTWTIVFLRLEKSQEELTAWVNEIEEAGREDRERGAELSREYQEYWDDPENWMVIERRPVSAEDKSRHDYYFSLSGKYLEGYDHYYLVQTEEQGRKLDEIAARYGLTLRRDRKVLFGRLEDFYTVHGLPDWMSQEDLAAVLQNDSGLSAREQLSQLSEACCSGDLFFTAPAYVDHLYWYQEGSFGINFTWETGDGRLIECYLFNSRYDTLSSGMELSQQIEDVSAYAPRAYLTRDGAEVTILESEHANAWGWRDKAFLYVYLPDSFLVVQMENREGLTPQDAEAVADSLRYGVILR